VFSGIDHILLIQASFLVADLQPAFLFLFLPTALPWALLFKAYSLEFFNE
jgi:hypothetical protein